jgi:hypothetical protein
MIRLSGFSVEGYKSFGKRTPKICIAPITIVLGRNNSGKSALCRAPLFFSRPLQAGDSREPFPLEIEGTDFGMNLLDLCFNQHLGGLKAGLFFDHSSIKSLKIGGAAIPEKAKAEEWIRFSHEEKDFKRIDRHFKNRTAKSILPEALNLMGTWDDLTADALEARAGNELKQLLDRIEEYL